MDSYLLWISFLSLRDCLFIIRCRCRFVFKTILESILTHCKFGSKIISNSLRVRLTSVLIWVCFQSQFSSFASVLFHPSRCEFLYFGFVCETKFVRSLFLKYFGWYAWSFVFYINFILHVLSHILFQVSKAYLKVCLCFKCWVIRPPYFVKHHMFFTWFFTSIHTSLCPFHPFFTSSLFRVQRKAFFNDF